ncbi:hypothetical protein ACFXHD_26740, partial [Streptomyces hydrogenans]|uniref:hypothetical protein n=1 Tax=Streptomyces hydrogenans TaxID=1873719 RepID=UPI0036AEE3D4
LRVPEAGALGRHFPFDPALITVPEPEPVEDDGREEYEVRLYHSGETTSLRAGCGAGLSGRSPARTP